MGKKSKVAPARNRPREPKTHSSKLLIEYEQTADSLRQAGGGTSLLSMGIGSWFWLLVFTAASFFTRFYQLTEPNLILFDEVHFGKFVNAHLTGSFYFDIHPPLVKLMMAGLLHGFTDYKGDQPFELIGETFLPTTPVFIFRFIPALAGSLLVTVVFLLTKRLGFTLWTSVLCTSMVAFDCLCIGESREITTDSCLILFFALAFFSHLSAEQYVLHSRGWVRWTAATGVFLGCSLSTKWTSLSVFGIVGLSTVVDITSRYVEHGGRHHRHAQYRDFLLRLVLLLGIPAVIYTVSFYIYFRTLPKSGPGDPFMPVNFQAMLAGSKHFGKRFRNIKPNPGFWDNFWALNKEMFRANKNVATPHHWQSYWYTWPFNMRGIACWNGERVVQTLASGRREVTQAFVYWFGNPFIWWFSTLCLFLSPAVFFMPAEKDRTLIPSAAPTRGSYYARTCDFPGRFGYLMFQVYTGWITSILPYALISRACFIYHYLPPLVFAILISGVLLDKAFKVMAVPTVIRLAVVLLLMSLFVYGLYFWAPLVYGWPLTMAENKARRWFQGWN